MAKFNFKNAAGESRVFECPQDVYAGSVEVMQGIYAGDDKKMPKLVAPRVLDIGGNVGAYACWAATVWPNARIFSYEPHPSNFDQMSANCSWIPNWEASTLAISDRYGYAPLLIGSSNCGCHSLYDVGESTDKSIQVATMPGSGLPQADVLKMDTEGAELVIATSLGMERLKQFKIVCFEWHRFNDKIRLSNLLLDCGFKCIKVHNTGYMHRGVLVFVKDN